MNIFDKAIEVLEEKGWVQGALVREEGVCAVGALRIAAGEQIPFLKWSRESNTVVSFISKMVPGREPGQLAVLSGWNDKSDRTFDDVIHLLKQASEAWDLEHPA
jgi:hypothetical protein